MEVNDDGSMDYVCEDPLAKEFSNLEKIKKPDNIPLPCFLCSDFQWKQRAQMTTSIHSFMALVWEVMELDSTIWSLDLKKRIIGHFADDCVLIHRNFNQLWNVFELHEFYKKNFDDVEDGENIDYVD